jgi:hypothetical protein
VLYECQVIEFIDLSGFESGGKTNKDIFDSFREDFADRGRGLL